MAGARRENPCEKNGCVECREGECSECGEGMFLKGGECEQCDWRCQECESERECKKCRSGFQLNKEDQRCYQCKVRQCGKCDEELEKCEECKTGYELREGKCEMTVTGKMTEKGEMTFEEFKRKYGKEYKDEKEEEKRRQIFESNKEAMETIK